MKTRTCTAGLCAAAVLSFATAPAALAQAAPANDPSASAGTEEVVVLSPFVVSDTDDASGYAVKDTLAGTRVRTELRDVASAISVISKQVLQDIGATDNASLLQYTMNTEVGGTRGNFLGANYANTSDSYGQGGQAVATNSLLRPSSNTRVRGLSAADNTRDYFLTEIPWDGYNVDRVDIQRGPNSILFGVGSPAGIVNTSVNPASFKTAYTIENKIDNWGSLRTSLDANQVLIPQTLAIRVAALDEHKQFEQEPAFEDARRLYLAARYSPQLVKGGLTSIRVNYEYGDIDANRPRTLTPEDYITPWFLSGRDANGVDGLNRRAFNRSVDSVDALVNRSTVNGNTQWMWINGFSVGRQYWPGTVGYYTSPDGNAATTYYTPMVSVRGGLGSNGAIDQTIGNQNSSGRPFSIASFKQYATNAAFPGNAYYGTKSLTDSSLFDFYENLLDGDNKREWQHWNAANLNLSQTFLDNRVGVELALDRQRYNDGQETILNGGSAFAIGVDMNSHYADGAVNPNFGRPYVAGNLDAGGLETRVERDASRLTAFGELRAVDFLGKSWLTKLLGRHVFTGLMSSDLRVLRTRQYALAMGDTNYPALLHEGTSFADNIRAYNWQVYLGDSLAGAASAAGADVSRINTTIDAPQTARVRIFNNNWSGTVNPADPFNYVDRDGNAQVSTQSENPANYVGWQNLEVDFQSVSRGDKESMIRGDSLGRNKVTSQGITWQGYMFDNCFVPVFGWREDTVKVRQGTDTLNAFGFADGSYDYDATKDTKTTGRSKSWGAVLHTPAGLAAKLPGRTSLSLFYNRSSNFKADEIRQDVIGTILENPTAQTKEYGFAISTLEDRVTLRVNWYETKMKNATLPSGVGFSYQQWAYPAWLVAHAARYQAVTDGRLADGNWDFVGTNNGSTPAMLAAALADMRNMPVSQTFWNSWGNELATIRADAIHAGDLYAAWPLWSAGRVDPQNATSPITRTGVGDTTSKGIEFDLTAQPVKNWNLTLNVAKVKASYDAVVPSIVTYMQEMTAFLDGPAGDIRMWGEGGNTFRERWHGDVQSSFDLLMANLGKSAPEVAPWRLNFISTYKFETGVLKNVYVGGGYRWEDKKILGYGLTSDRSTIDTERPLYGPSIDHVDLWVGYSRKLTAKINWRIQLNVRNVGESHHLTPASLNPDGSWSLVRIEDGMSWQLSNTISF